MIGPEGEAVTGLLHLPFGDCPQKNYRVDGGQRASSRHGGQRRSLGLQRLPDGERRTQAGPEYARPEREIDRRVGERIRERRITLGLTQQRMAEQIGITYQQANKYEFGINRATAARLYDIAQALGVDVGYFFEPAHAAPAETEASGRLMLELARNFAAISDLARIIHRVAAGAT